MGLQLWYKWQLSTQVQITTYLRTGSYHIRTNTQLTTDRTSPYDSVFQYREGHLFYFRIHPRYKQDVANRLTLGARAVAYGEGNVVYQGPFPTAVIRIASADLLVEFDDGKDVLRMNNASAFDVSILLFS